MIKITHREKKRKRGEKERERRMTGLFPE